MLESPTPRLTTWPLTEWYERTAKTLVRGEVIRTVLPGVEKEP
ncbi:hypothetical protein [Pseudarthrobacter sp. PS3-L1]|nr:hypothetical protein [Pseudarthrobacter sp. PS3-L1]MDJ0321622.1 hypothetical protein [Pseudarthrobacter sp. PS3-L1]